MSCPLFVSPVFRKGKKEDPGKYRLLTSIARKTVDLLLLEIISRHVKDEKIISISHHGFTKGIRETTKYILCLSERC